MGEVAAGTCNSVLKLDRPHKPTAWTYVRDNERSGTETKRMELRHVLRIVCDDEECVR